MKVLLLLSITAAIVAKGDAKLKCHKDAAGTATAQDCDSDDQDRCLTTYKSERVTSFHVIEFGKPAFALFSFNF